MPNKRKEGKKLVGFFATPEEVAQLQGAAEAEGLTVADFLRKVIRDAPSKSPTKKRGVKPN